MSIFPSNRGDVFLLTEKGEAAVEDLEGPEFNEVVERCSLVNKVFKGMSGTKIKNFIYENFPEVVAKPIGKEI